MGVRIKSVKIYIIGTFERKTQDLGRYKIFKIKELLFVTVG